MARPIGGHVVRPAKMIVGQVVAGGVSALDVGLIDRIGLLLNKVGCWNRYGDLGRRVCHRGVGGHVVQARACKAQKDRVIEVSVARQVQAVQRSAARGVVSCRAQVYSGNVDVLPKCAGLRCALPTVCIVTAEPIPMTRGRIWRVVLIPDEVTVIVDDEDRDPLPESPLIVLAQNRLGLVPSGRHGWQEDSRQ